MRLSTLCFNHNQHHLVISRSRMLFFIFLFNLQVFVASLCALRAFGDVSLLSALVTSTRVRLSLIICLA